MSPVIRRRRTTTPPRVVIDTNLLLSALVFRGDNTTLLRLAWQRGACLPLVSSTTVHELIRVLAYPKFQLSPSEQHELLADYLPYSHSVQIPQPPPAVPHCRDVFDIPFLELAIVGKADALISGDKDLLMLADKFSVPILTLASFLAQLHGKP